MDTTERVRAAYVLMREVNRPEIWISVREESEVIREAQDIDRRVASGEHLVLAGMVGALKDNIDLAGVMTTAGCPEYGYLPEQSATCVDRLQAHGLLFIGKTNLDQFATGLVGTRSPYGRVACVSDPKRISGGSSSGSAVAVALGIVDIALGTDTAGSGRVPAAFNAIIGLKPTRGLISNAGVVPACPSIDCVSIFAREVRSAHLAFTCASGFDTRDPMSRRRQTTASRTRALSPVIGVVDSESLDGVDAPRRALYELAKDRVAELGASMRTVDIGALERTGALLYGGGFVAERYASVGAFVDAHPNAVDPVVGSIISAARAVPAHLLASDLLEVARVRHVVDAMFEGIDLLMLPTTGEHPTFAEVDADPIGVNARLGRYTTFCNLLDLCAVSTGLPAAVRQRHPLGETFGVTLFGAAFTDDQVAGFAARFHGEAPLTVDRPARSQVVVVGAHLSGQPLNAQLSDRGARLVETTSTADDYRLYALDTTPPKPGLVRLGSGYGRAIEVEVWELEPAKFAEFITEVTAPLAIAPVRLVDGREIPGFVLSQQAALDSAQDITDTGGWRSYLSR